MACSLVDLDKRPGVRPVGIGETLRRALTKIIMRSAGDQEKTACGIHQLCAGLEADIEGESHAVGQRRVERARARRVEEEDEEATEAEKEEGEEVVAGLNLDNLTIETEVTQEEA